MRKLKRSHRWFVSLFSGGMIWFSPGSRLLLEGGSDLLLLEGGADAILLEPQ